jgi:hypothetical protein
MHGERLLAMYQMCLTNSASMLQSLNLEIMHKDVERTSNTIGIAEYLLFLDEIKSYVPIVFKQADVGIPQSAACILT